ncbi:MAG: hypothetical protein RIQ60_1626 [Pseudomonadota bacterium]
MITKVVHWTSQVMSSWKWFAYHAITSASTSTFRRDPHTRYIFPRLARAILDIRLAWWEFRVLRGVHKLLGYQFRPTADHIEIDLTNLCNLRCNNCNRSSAQAPEARNLELEHLHQFVTDSLAQQRDWSRIRLLGGEPTLHPHFDQIFEILKPLRTLNGDIVIEVVTNGYGEKVQRRLPTGYYPSAIAGGIDRVTRAGQGRSSLPATEDEMCDLMDRTCRLCGRFRDGYFKPHNLLPALVEQQTSASWQRICTEWSARPATRLTTTKEDGAA